MKNYYEILEVNKRASKEVIDKAYKVLIKKYHPDLYKGEKHQYAERKAKEINEAYSILSNDFLKEQYDIELEKQEEQQKIRKQSQIKRNEEIQKQKENTEEKEPSETKRAKVGTLGAVVELTQNLIELIQKKGKKKGKRKKITAKDVIAVVLTIVIVVLVGVTLWFIPFTNGWMKELLFENPLFNWIGTLFS